MGEARRSKMASKPVQEPLGLDLVSWFGLGSNSLVYPDFMVVVLGANLAIMGAHVLVARSGLPLGALATKPPMSLLRRIDSLLQGGLSEVAFVV